MRTRMTMFAETVKSRPLGCFCGGLMIFTALLLFAPASLKIALLILSPIAALLLFLVVKSKGTSEGIRATALLFALLFMATGVSSAACLAGYDLFDRKVKTLADEGAEVVIEGYPIETVYESDLSCCYLLKVTKLNGERVRGVTILSLFSPDDKPTLFKTLSANGTLCPPESSDPSFDSLSYYRSKGIFAQITPTKFSQENKIPLDPGYPLHLLQAKVNEHIDNLLSDRAASLTKALLLGDKSALSATLKRDFKTLGLSHLLAVSGLHLSVLFGMWSFLLTKLRIPLKIRCILLIPLIFLFCALCSFSLSVIRAAVMLVLLLLSKIVNEDNDSATSLLLAGGLIVFFSPFSVFDVGFLLSFFATFGILQVSPLLMKKKLKEKKVRTICRNVFNSLAVSLAAQIAVLPVMYLCFGSISILSPIATLLFSPFISLLLYLAPLSLLLFFVPLLSDILFSLTDCLCLIIEQGASTARYLKEGLVCTDRPLLAALLCVLMVGACLFFFTRHKKCFAALLGVGYLLFSALCLLLPQFDSPQTLSGINGKNDLLILYEGAESLIVDLSDGSKKNMRLSLQLLEDETGDLNPDGILLTHYHQRHLATFSALCEEYYPERLYLTPPQNEKEEGIYLGLCALAQKHRVEVIVIENEEACKMGSFTIKNLSRSYIKRSTHPILSFTLLQGEDSLSYLSSSAHEKLPLSLQERIYLGVHGPVIKQPLPTDLVQNHDLLFAAKETAEQYGCPGGKVRSSSLLFE